MQTQVNDIAINYALEGPAGAPCVTFITGIANDFTMWDDQIPALTDAYRVLRFDSRGHGASAASPPPYTLPQLAGDVVGLWDALGVERSVLAGLGLGGVVAVEVASSHPDRVTGLVPVSCRAEVTPAYAAIWPPLIDAVKANGIASIVEMTASRWFTDAFKAANPAVLESVRQMIGRTSEAGYFGSVAALLTLDYADRLGELAMPILFVSGGEDALGGPPEVMQTMCDGVRDGRHVVLDGATHISTICNPQAFNRALREFLDAR